MDLVFWQKQTYYTQAQGLEFTEGALVWVYCPEWKRSLFRKLMSYWVGPCIDRARNTI